MDEWTYKAAYLVLLAAAGIIRGYYGRIHRKTEKALSKKSAVDRLGLFLGFFAIGGFPLAYVFTNWLDAYNMGLPEWARVLGAVIYALGTLFLLWVHRTLGRNFSPELEIMKGHKLVTEGPYKYIRHPMYSAHYLLFLGQWLLLSNWLVGIAGILFGEVLVRVRGPVEERMMIEQFGEKYRRYMKRTGGVMPKFR